MKALLILSVVVSIILFCGTALGQEGCNNMCHTNAECVNSTCVCNDGYYGNGTYCENIDECALFAECVNSTGSSENCSNLDFCNSYYGYRICVDTEGGYECQCPYGYYLSPYSGQCVANGSSCPDCCGFDEYCSMNTDYECQCVEGYERYDDDDCIPINGSCPNCSSFEECGRHTGYECECIDGYDDDRNGYCEDENECEEDCLRGECTNTEGSFTCTCDEGYYFSEVIAECIPLDSDGPVRVPAFIFDVPCNEQVNCIIRRIFFKQVRYFIQEYFEVTKGGSGESEDGE